MMKIKNQKVLLSAAKYKDLCREHMVMNRIAQLKAANPGVNEKLLRLLALRELRKVM